MGESRQAVLERPRETAGRRGDAPANETVIWVWPPAEPEGSEPSQR